MKAYLVCDPDSGCVVKLAETASKARWAGCSDMGGSPSREFEQVRRLSVHRIPRYDGDDQREAHDRYWAEHDLETGEPIDERTRPDA